MCVWRTYHCLPVHVCVRVLARLCTGADTPTRRTGATRATRTLRRRSTNHAPFHPPPVSLHSVPSTSSSHPARARAPRTTHHASRITHQTVARRSTPHHPYPPRVRLCSYWSGYFTSRPALKAYIRESTVVQQAARQLQVLTGGAADLGPTNPLYTLERAIGVTQHHDAVSGTAKQVRARPFRGLWTRGCTARSPLNALSCVHVLACAARDVGLPEAPRSGARRGV
ncbi:hypothetical protein EON67_01345 [archaeon]|nr:MAG: hypothetical protein EON67_01345 [archaeon]